MEALEPTSRSYLRTLLVLGRASNLPTVWSNCLAGWLLGEGGHVVKLGMHQRHDVCAIDEDAVVRP